MTIAIIVGVCLILLALAFLLPRLSRHPQRATDRTLAAGQRAAGSAPGGVGRLLQRPFRSSRNAASRSASAGRRGRSKLPG